MNPASPTLAVAAVLALTAAALPAQRVQWQLPAHGAAVYQRQGELEALSLDPEVAQPADLAQGLHDGLLFADDLDPRRQHIARAPLDLRDLIAHVALDLRQARSGGDCDAAFPPVARCGLLQIQGRWQRPDSAGNQTFVGKLASVPRNKLSPAGLDGEAQLANDRELDGRLLLARRVDVEAGRVVRFTAMLRADVDPTEDSFLAPFTLDLEEEWVWRENLGPDSGVFKERVGQAILRGREHVEQQLSDHLDRLRPARGDGARVDQAGGSLALMLLTLLKCGRSGDEPLLRRGFDRLRERELRDTYSLGLALMALEARYADPGEREALLLGLRESPAQRQPIRADAELMRRWVERLLDNRDESVDRAYLSRWHYQGGRSYDNSNTQYALLGLWSAQLCGIEISPTVWWSAAAHFLDARCASEGDLTLTLLDHAGLRRAQDRERPPTNSAFRTEIRGWSYHGGQGQPTASMTTGGVSSLTICLAALSSLRVAHGEKFREIQAARHEGLAWLATHHDVRGNTGHRDPLGWHDYFLYGLERACELGRVARLQDRDWYFEGAALLCALQQPSGAFRTGRVYDTCFALLFLKKASLPVYTGGR